MSTVTTSIENSEDDPRLVVIQVTVKSLKNPKVSAKTEINPTAAKDSEALNRLVYLAGAGCAEYLNEHHGENHDPSTCGKLAMEDMAREARLMNELNRGFPERLTKLLASPLLPRDRETADRLKFKSTRGGAPTRQESEWVNLKLRQMRKVGTQL